MPTSARRKIGIEPVEVDLLVAPATLSSADRQEINAFFREQRKRNDQDPAVQAIRNQLARKKAKAAPAMISATSISVNKARPCTTIVSAPAKDVAAKKAVPAAAKRATMAKKK